MSHVVRASSKVQATLDFGADDDVPSERIAEWLKGFPGS